MGRISSRGERRRDSRQLDKSRTPLNPRLRILVVSTLLTLGIFFCHLNLGRAYAEDESDSTPFRFSNSDWSGTSELIALLRDAIGAENVLVSHQLPLDKLSPDDSILMLFPKREQAVEDLVDFLVAGGRMLLADDFGQANSLMLRFGVKEHHPISDAKNFLAQNPNIGVAFPYDAGHGTHPLLSGVSEIVSNYPSGFGAPEHLPLTSLLSIVREDGEDDVIFAVGTIGSAARCKEVSTPSLARSKEKNGATENIEAGDCGRIVLLGDPSIWINRMLRYPSNRQLAVNSAKYLIQRDQQPKTVGKLWVLSGDFKTTGSFGERDTLGEMRRWLRERLEALQIALSDRQQFGQQMASWLSMAFILWWAFSRLFHKRQHLPPLFLRTQISAGQTGDRARSLFLSSAKVSAAQFYELEQAIDRIQEESADDNHQKLRIALRQAAMDQLAPAKGLKRLIRDAKHRRLAAHCINTLSKLHQEDPPTT